MKSLFILLGVTNLISSSLSAKLVSAPAKQLPVPQLTQTVVIEDHLLMKWDPVKVEEGNTILGYKVKNVGRGAEQVFFFEEIDGVKQLVSRFEPVTDMKTIPKSDPIVVVVGPHETEAIIKDIKKHVQYQIRLQTFNEDGEGPYSPPTGIKLGDDKPK